MSKKDLNKTTESTETNETEVPTEVTAEQALTAENESLIAELDKATEENKKLTETVARLQSSADKSDAYLTQLVAMKNDFESYKRRMKFSAEQAKQDGVLSVAQKLIAVADNFELAGKHLEGDNLKAFEMIHKQFVDILHEIGVVETDVLGKPFDHNSMNALSKLDRGEENKDLVVEVYKKGYMFGDRVVRYAEVIVGA
jgi:molecular chaperone GrpE